VAAGASIEFLAPAREGDVLRAVAGERWRARRSGIYEIEVVNQRGEIVALFRGRSHQVAGRLIDD
jgi:acyl-CoA thioesterase